MYRIALFVLVLMIVRFIGLAQIAGQLTPIQQVPLNSSSIAVATKYQSAFSTTRSLQMPNGFKAQVFYAGNLLSKPRFMAWSADSVLHVANMTSGNIIALPDRNRDGIADTAYVAANNVSGAHDVRFFRGSMYVAQTNQVLKLEDTNSDGFYETRAVIISGLPSGGHVTRTILFDERNEKLYVSIGSRCNACREPTRAVIEQYDVTGQNRRIFATGARNAVGLALHPVTNRLWANNNGNDNQGNDIPPEWIDIVRDDGFYGYPFVHSHQQWFNFNAAADYRALMPITATDSADVRRQVAPAALIQAHSAPMSLLFSNTSFPPPYRNGLWCVYRGSWNRSPATGYKLVYLDFTNAQDTLANFVTDVVVGFQTPSVWGRPVGLALDQRGNMYLGSDDLTQAIYHISTATTTATHETTQLIDMKVFPNPVRDHLTCELGAFSDSETVIAEVFDALGRLVLQKKLRERREILTTQNLANGTYLLRVSIGNRFTVKQFVIER
jgi:glucose/arabinose dehydrogenase